jgi:hypothetical protein
MRLGALLAVLTLHFLAACSDPSCEAIAPGTPISSLPPLYGSGSPCGSASSDVALIECCVHPPSDAGCGTDCDALAPYGSAGLSGRWAGGDGQCGYGASWQCGVWYRNGKVLDTQLCCID